jgi:hypothetical protein
MNFVVNVEHCQRAEHAIIIVVLKANDTEYDSAAPSVVV